MITLNPAPSDDKVANHIEKIGLIVDEFNEYEFDNYPYNGQVKPPIWLKSIQYMLSLGYYFLKNDTVSFQTVKKDLDKYAKNLGLSFQTDLERVAKDLEDWPSEKEARRLKLTCLLKDIDAVYQYAIESAVKRQKLFAV